MHEFAPGNPPFDPDVVMRARMDAIEAKGAVHVASLARLEQVELAAGDRAPPANTVLGRAIATNAGIAHAHVRRRHVRLHEVELAYRTHVLAERGTAKETIYQQGRAEVAEGNPRGPPRRRPQ